MDLKARITALLNAHESMSLDDDRDRATLAAALEAFVSGELALERERIAANLDRFIGMGNRWGLISCISLIRSAQRDIRNRTEGNHG
jgi:hypothetical protein